MKKSNKLQLDWVKINLLKMDPAIRAIAGWNAQDIFLLKEPLRTRFSDEDQSSFVNYLCATIAAHIERTEHEIDFDLCFAKFRKMFNIN